MSSYKNIIFITDNENDKDISRLYDAIKSENHPYDTMDDSKYGLGISQIFYISGVQLWWYTEFENWHYFGINNLIDKEFKNFKILCDIKEKMDYDAPNNFSKSTIELFKYLSDCMGDNNLYVLIHDDLNREIIYLPILDCWKGNFYDKLRQRDKKLNTIL